MKKKLIVVLLIFSSGIVVLDVLAKKFSPSPTHAEVAAVTQPAATATPPVSVVPPAPHKNSATATQTTQAHGSKSVSAHNTKKHTPAASTQLASAAHSQKQAKQAKETKPAKETRVVEEDKNVALNTAVVRETPAQAAINQEVAKLCASSSTAPAPSVLKLALTAYNCAVATGTARPRTLTVIDYSLPSTQKRMWVYDLARNRLLYNTFTAHGQGSGGVIPDYFSNRAQTHASSLGLFLTTEEYIGHEGYSLRLRGLENGFNDQAESRGIVVHGAPYVSAAVARSGRLGRSWGCPAVPQDMAQPIINCIKHGNLVFSYYPDTKWLKHSKFLHCPIPSTMMAAAHFGPSASSI